MIAAIDIGYRNLGICFMSIKTKKFYTRKVDLVKMLKHKSFKERFSVEYIQHLFEEYKECANKRKVYPKAGNESERRHII